MNFAMIFPMCALFCLTATVLVLMWLVRVRSVATRQVPIKYYRHMQGAEVPEIVTKTGRHFSNLFEAPVLFYAACILAIILPLHGSIVVWAWLYVAARAAHAIIHIGPNRVMPRMTSYALGWIALTAMWILIFLEAVSRSASV